MNRLSAHAAGAAESPVRLAQVGTTTTEKLGMTERTEALTQLVADDKSPVDF